MKKVLLLIITAILCAMQPALLRAESLVAQDTIKSDVAWSADTVHVMASIHIWDDVTLTIEPGTRVEFHGPYHIHVHGTIRAEGTKQDTIKFTMADTTGFHDYSVMDGAWDGIIFNNIAGFGGANGAMNDNDTSVFNFCLLEYTKSTPSSLAWAAIESDVFSNLVIKNCEIRNCYTHSRGAAIMASSESDIKILYNYIHHNEAGLWGGAIYSRNNACKIRGNKIEYNSVLTMDPENGKGGGIALLGMNPTVQDNLIRYNSAIYGSGIYMFNCFGLVDGNIITYNTGIHDPPELESSGGGIIAEYGCTANIVNNKIANNTADNGAGIEVFQSDVRIIGNLIVNNTANNSSGAMRGTQFEGFVLNNTIVNNEAAIAGAMEFVDAEPLFANNIVWNNPDNGGFQIKLLGYFAKLHIQNSVIKDGLSSAYGESTATASNMITEHPKFAKPSMGLGSGVPGLQGNKWWVRDSSVCINSGLSNPGVKLPPKDLEGNDRVLHSIIDIGAYETYIPVREVRDTIKTNTTWIADTVKVTGDIIVADDVVLTILPGTVVQFQGRYKLQVIGTLIAEGMANQVIRFTLADTTGFYDREDPAGSWKGIRFENDLEFLESAMDDNLPSSLKFCDIRYVKCIDGESWIVAGVYVRYFDGLSLTNCRLSNNAAAFEPCASYFYKSDITMKGCVFEDNIGNEGAAVWSEISDLVIEDCIFSGNYAGNLGGAIRTNSGELTVKNSDFRWNGSGNHGGAIFMERTRALITHSNFENNSCGTRGGAIAAYYENFELINNIMVNNTAWVGGSVYCLYVDDALTMNNTICNNWANDGGGFYNAFANHTSINDLYYGNQVDGYGNQYGLYTTSADLKFQNCLLQGGGDDIGWYIGQELNGVFEEILDVDPELLHPSEGPGTDFDAGPANWGLKSISPCINGGIAQGPSYEIEFDIRNNPRVFDEVIDIGAIESQYGLPEFIRNLDNYLGCEGDTVLFVANARFESLYQWIKDGKIIIGATDDTLLLAGITPEKDGNYVCRISNAFGSVETNPAYVLARSAPNFVRQPQSLWGIKDERTIIPSSPAGTEPLNLQWFKDGVELPGKIFPDLWINNTGPEDEGRYHIEASNACAVVSSDTVQMYLAPQICMVTVDTTTGYNLVVWEKNTDAPIESYNVYRESSIAGQYITIGNIPASELSVFADTAANPAAQAYIYKITGILDDGSESDIDLCTPHTTIHLLNSVNTEYQSSQLDWNPYYGFDYGTFFIYRKAASASQFSITHEMASSTNTWLDLTGKGDVYQYRVAVERAELCYPTGNGKAGTGPYQHSLSNLDDNKKLISGIEETLVSGLKIYPNPFSEETTIRFPNPESSEYNILIRDMSGKLVFTGSTSQDHFKIQRGDLASGIYSLEMQGKKVYRERMMIR